MKKTITLCLLSSFMLAASAQGNETPAFERGIFNHLGVNVGVGTEGFSFSLAAPLTPFVEITAGISTTPTININDPADIDDGHRGYGTTNLKMSIQRTAFDLRANIYPFGGDSHFFVAPGLSMGGGTLIEVSAHSSGVEQAMRQGGQHNFSVRNEGYDFAFDASGMARAEGRVNSVRPYLGIGSGRHVSKGRVGFCAELGAQFMGKLKFYQYDREIIKDPDSDKAIYEKLSIYPVLRLTLTGRIL